MFKTLSKSIKKMFTFDLFVLVVATIIILNYNLSMSCNLYVRVFSVALVVIAGLFPYNSLRQLIVAGWSHINMQPVFSVDEEKECGPLLYQTPECILGYCNSCKSSVSRLWRGYNNEESSLYCY